MLRRMILCTVFSSLTYAAWAGDYPNRPVTLIVPQPAGGAVDGIARALGEELGRRMGTTFVIQNRSGASGILGTDSVVRSAHDGYTLLVSNSTPVLTVPYMFDKVPYDVDRDLRFITQIGSGQLVLVVNSEVPATNMKTFLSWADQNRGKVNYGSFGVGSSGHLVAAYLNRSNQLDMTHVPFKGEVPLIQELVAGRISVGFTTLASVVQHLHSGRLRALALIGDERSKVVPDVPTMKEAGMPDSEYKPMGWFALLAPSGVPKPVLDRLEQEARAAINTPAMRARLEAYGMEPIANSSEEARKSYESLLPVAESLVKISGAKLE